MRFYKELQSFYSTLYSSNFTAESKQACSSFLDDLDIPRLSEQHKDVLDRPISKAELLLTLKSMHHNKTPGFDALPVEFYFVFFFMILLTC